MKIPVFAALLLVFSNEISGQSIQYQYDKFGRTGKITYPNQQSILYTYDKDGNRVSQIISNFNLVVVPLTLSYPNTGTTKKVGVTSNTTWTVTPNQSWVTVNKTSGTNNDSVAITTTTNPLPANRIATVTFSAGVLSQVVTITQDGIPSSNDYLTLDKSAYTSAMIGDLTSILVTSNRSWTVLSDQPWTQYTPSSGNGTGYFSISTFSNTTQQNRFSTVTVTAGSLQKTVAVTQLGSPADISTLNSGAVNFVVFPNPFQSSVSIQTNEVVRNAQVFDELGRFIKNVKPTATLFDISLVEMKAGIYIVQLEHSNGTTTYSKIFKE